MVSATSSNLSTANTLLVSRAQRSSWMLLGALGGAVLSALAFVGAGYLQTALVDHARQTAVLATSSAHTLNTTPASASAKTKRLPGISGEMFTPAVALNDTLASDQPRGEISLAAWDRLSSGNCIKLTTKSGQTLSFRIVGARPVDGANDNRMLPEIDLAITSCEGAGEPISKAVIESSEQPAKDAVAQHTL
ncbi:MAG: hypothetical protein P8Y67_09825 [Alphaproteobacteria bacterium]